LWRIEGLRERRVELWVPAPRNPRHELVAVHRGRRIDRADRTRRNAVPITTPVRTLIDVSARMEDDRLLAEMESLFLRELMTPERLEKRLGALRSSGRPGAGRLERLLEARGGAPLESRLEAKVWLALRRSNVRAPVRQYWVAAPGGRYRLDFAWPDCQVALECDGWAQHGTRLAFGKDRARLSDLVSLGWRVLVVTWEVATKSPERLVRWVDSALAKAVA
jgi:very-short-patch-repair endonuclease